MLPVLQDPHLTLRELRLADADAITAACQDPESQRWTTVPVPYQHDDAVAWVRRQAAEKAAQRWHWAITRTGADDAWLGTISLRLLDPANALHDVGFLVAPHVRGEGIATAAVRMVCRYAVHVVGSERVEWRAHVGNDASRAVARNAGFVEEGIQRSRVSARGVRHDCWTAALLPGDLTRPDDTDDVDDTDAHDAVDRYL